MKTKNTSDHFGWVTRCLHWAMALLVITALAMGFWLTQAEFSLATIAYFGYHKSIGFVILSLFVVRVLWHRYSKAPNAIEGANEWQYKLAHLTHRLLYFLMFAMPLSGWIASSATGIETVIFSRWLVWSIAPTSDVIADIGFAIHGILGKALAALVGLHIGGALYHAVVLRDGTLRRMILGALVIRPPR